MSEKLETIISRGLANTRMRDFYDIHILLKTHGERINPSVLASAVQATTDRRESAHLLQDGTQTLDEVFQSIESERMWRRYQKQFMYADEISWGEIKDSTLRLWYLVEELL